MKNWLSTLTNYQWFCWCVRLKTFSIGHVSQGDIEPFISKQCTPDPDPGTQSTNCGPKQHREPYSLKQRLFQGHQYSPGLNAQCSMGGWSQSLRNLKKLRLFWSHCWELGLPPKSQRVWLKDSEIWHKPGPLQLLPAMEDFTVIVTEDNPPSARRQGSLKPKMCWP